MAEKQVPFTKHIEVIHEKIHSSAHAIEIIMNGLEEHQDSHSVEDLQDVLKTALSDLESLYVDLMGDGENDEGLSEVIHRTHHS